MWQQLGRTACNYSDQSNPSGCNADLFPWWLPWAPAPACAQPNHYTEESTGEGRLFRDYNVQQGDAPYLKALADNYAMSDN